MEYVLPIDSVGRISTEDADRAHEFLHQHAGDADHGQAPVVELLRLHRRECLLGLGLEAKGVEAEVSRVVFLPEPTLAGDGAGLSECGGDGLVLHQGHAEKGEHPELFFTKQATEASDVVIYVYRTAGYQTKGISHL